MTYRLRRISGEYLVRAFGLVLCATNSISIPRLSSVTVEGNGERCELKLSFVMNARVAQGAGTRTGHPVSKSAVTLELSARRLSGPRNVGLLVHR